MKVPAKRTPWAAPGDHHAIVVNMDRILRNAGVLEEHVRRRITAHAIVASGWRQAVWNHNVWGVKTGKSWTGDYYTMTTQEEIGGKMVTIPDDAWRSFPSFVAAIHDFQGRISASSGRYGQSHKALIDPARPDSDYWAELGKAHYYTDTQNMTPPKFQSLCNRVRRELGQAGSATTPVLVGVVGLLVLAVIVAYLMRG